MKNKLIIGLLCLVMVLLYRECSSNDTPISEEAMLTEQKVKVKETGKVDVRAQKIDKLLSTARQYLGTPHAYGKQSKKGMDCSGLVNLSFSTIAIQVPRSSKDMAHIGQTVTIPELAPGDIVLFTHPGGTTITHSGIVTQFKNPKNIQFIHTSSSKGVVEESMTSNYWSTNFIMAKRIIPLSK